MRPWVVLPLMALSLTTAVVTAESVLSDLFYTTATPCTALHALPTQLLPHDQHFHGSVTLSKSDAAVGCVLHVAVRGEVDRDAEHDAFALARKVDQSLTKLVDVHGLRGADEPTTLHLQRLRVKVENRDYAMDARAVGDAATGEVTLNGDGCDGFASEKMLADLVNAAERDVSVVPGQVDVANCAIALDVVGRGPVFETANDAVAFLQAVDTTVGDWFGPSATKQTMATLRSARLSFSPPTSAVLEAAMTTDLAAQSHVNAPTKQITMGILMGLTMLTAMLVGIAYQKKRHEQSQQQRHDNASRAAQIRRVSYRMGYEPVRNQEANLGTDEEEKDGLL